MMVLGKFNRAVDLVLGQIVGILILFVTLFLCMNVIRRYLFASPLYYADELTTYICIAFTFLGSVLLVRYGWHVSVDIVQQYVKREQTKITFEIIITVFILLFSFFIAYFGIEQIQRSIIIGDVSPALRVPFYIPYISLPLSGVLMFLQALEQIIEKLKAMIKG